MAYKGVWLLFSLCLSLSICLSVCPSLSRSLLVFPSKMHGHCVHAFYHGVPSGASGVQISKHIWALAGF